MNDDFYIGYLDRAPLALGRWLKRRVLGGLMLAMACLLFMAVTQTPMGTGRFEYGVVRSFEGIVVAEPLPMLRVGLGGPRGEEANYLVVGVGKQGVAGEWLRLDGRRVRFRGSLIERDGIRMVEWNDPGSLEVIEGPAVQKSVRESENLGEISLVGELVDTKCYLGVMRPGSGKVHRGCAIRCLSGGVPPGLLVQRDDGREAVLPLVADAKAVPWKVAWAGREIVVRGRLERRDGILVLRASRTTLRDAVP